MILIHIRNTFALNAEAHSIQQRETSTHFGQVDDPMYYLQLISADYVLININSYYNKQDKQLEAESPTAS